jgi:hypothetical protein
VLRRDHVDEQAREVGGARQPRRHAVAGAWFAGQNFALAGVIAVASADGEVERPEYELLVRFKAILGATLDLPAAK